ncbi:hypothetical protein [Flaviflexus equikiangi]|uniref:Uncharacterized protein n=1 Tax=Flaviflexus equikiangi TaxID=2758573 RepID=A0ABS2TJA4_9ACTO|nr:hypothetical protein [Flaviflexus equikiangi]MBM9433364.1 hypothetical protein [Flaviflexus equikiangi]
MMASLKTGLKAMAAVFLWPLSAFSFLFVGVVAKDRKIMAEGALYAGVFLVAVSLPTLQVLGTAAAFIGLGSMAAAGIRSYQYRHLWLTSHRRPVVRPVVTPPQPIRYVTPTVTTPVPAQPPVSAQLPVQATDSTRDLGSALTWVVSRAKQNKHRLPGDAYVRILELCQTLDSIVDAEAHRTVPNARFEYELNAIVRDYLPTVLRNYLAIPADLVGTPLPNGRTPDEELIEQLRLLDGQADSLYKARHGSTSADLSTTGNFLRDRFGHRTNTFDFGIE